MASAPVPAAAAPPPPPKPAPAATAPHYPVATPAFTPRQTYETSHSLPKTYFLGHHAKTLRQVRDSLSSVHLIIECRDARLPLTTWNPDLEAATAGRSRIVAYTKADLLFPEGGRAGARERERCMSVLEAAAASPGSGLAHEGCVVLAQQQQPQRGPHRRDQRGRALAGLLDMMARVSREKDILTGLQVMVVGMPNVGKSTLLNSLRVRGMGGGGAGGGDDGGRRRMAKVAQTGQQPGITRSIGSAVRVLDMDPPVFVKDTPGVFVPYVPDGESMLKLALVAGVKHSLIPDVLLADYLLYRLNRVSPRLYDRFCPGPTNDVVEWLEAVARATCKLRPGGRLDLEGAAAFVLHRFRDGRLGRFPLDDLDLDAIERKRGAMASPARSMNQLRKEAKETRLRAAKQKHLERTRG